MTYYLMVSAFDELTAKDKLAQWKLEKGVVVEGSHAESSKISFARSILSGQPGSRVALFFKEMTFDRRVQIHELLGQAGDRSRWEIYTSFDRRTVEGFVSSTKKLAKAWASRRKLRAKMSEAEVREEIEKAFLAGRKSAR